MYFVIWKTEKGRVFFFYKDWIIASANSLVVLVPPISTVVNFPILIVLYIAVEILSAYSFKFKCLNIMVAESNNAVGLAEF